VTVSHRAALSPPEPAARWAKSSEAQAHGSVAISQRTRRLCSCRAMLWHEPSRPWRLIHGAFQARCALTLSLQDLPTPHTCDRLPSANSGQRVRRVVLDSGTGMGRRRSFIAFRRCRQPRMPLPGFLFSRGKARVRLGTGGPDPTERTIRDLDFDVVRQRFATIPRSFNSVYTVLIRACSAPVGLLSSLPAPMVIRLRVAAAGTRATEDLFFPSLSSVSRPLWEPRRT